jgi:FMN phosphatase YigB (HAD superfamily)
LVADHRDCLQGVRLYLFDLDGTLRRVRPSSHEALVTYAGELGHTFDAAAQRRGLLWSHTYWADAQQIRADRERLEPQAFWENYLRRYLEAMEAPAAGCEDVIEALSRRFVEDFKPQGHLAPGAKELLWHLRSEQHVLGLLSNRREPLTGVAIGLGIIEYFHFTLAAGQVGSWKPDAPIFQQALALAGGIPPQEAVHVGDNYYTDVIGARQVGMRAVLLDPHGIYEHVADECLLIRDLSDLKAYLPG